MSSGKELCASKTAEPQYGLSARRHRLGGALVELSGLFGGQSSEPVAVHIWEAPWAVGQVRDPVDLPCLCTQLSVLLERLRQVSVQGGPKVSGPLLGRPSTYFLTRRMASCHPGALVNQQARWLPS